MKYLFLLVIAGYAFMPFRVNDGFIDDMVSFSDTSISEKKPREELSFTVSMAVNSRIPLNGVAGFSRQGRPIGAFYFPGTSDKRALVIGGVHGSELSAIEVAKTLIEQLHKEESIYYSVIVIPCLFPDNANYAASQPMHIGSVYNFGRYSHQEAADPNRQMPGLGTAFDHNNPFDYVGRPIEPENQLLLKFIQEFRPQRIVNLHAIRSIERAGVYADPRTDSKGIALEYASDSSLAVDMARHIEAGGGMVPGNCLARNPAALYYADPSVASPGFKQKRNLQGSRLPGNRGFGVSLGSWASTAVEDPLNPRYNRPAIRLLTMEFPGYKRPVDYKDIGAQEQRSKQVELYASSISQVFLSRKYEEPGM